jgi:FkbM family methyltransferase
MSLIKNAIKEVLILLRIDLTKNIKYDRLTNIILKRYVTDSTNCIDVGCHKGEILDVMLRYAPNGKHFAFEPIPYLFKALKEKFAARATVYPYALSDNSGRTTFQLVKNAPAYSGIKRRKYDIDNPEIEEIEVEVMTLDELIPEMVSIQLVKIDVEGGELGVLKGAKQLLKRNLPIVIFECGKGASEYYGTTPADVFDYMANEIGLKVFTLEAFIAQKSSLSKSEFEHLYESGQEYYFVAAA